MTRIAVVLASLRPGGAERAMLNLAKGLTTRGHSVDLVVFDARGAYRELRPPSANLVDLGSRRIRSGLPKLVSYFRRTHPGYVISAVDHVNIASLIAHRISGQGGRIFPTVHKVFGRPAGGGSILARGLERSLARWLYPKTHAVIAVSMAVQRSMQGLLGMSEANIRVIPNPVVDESIQRLAGEHVDDEWLESQAGDVIVGMGRLVPHKDFATLISAFARLRREEPARLLIIGEGPARSRLEALVRERAIEDSVHLPGFVKNPYAYLGRAKLFVQSSLSESFGIAMVEAMALGVPVVSTACGGPEEILAGGRFGKLVDVGDVQALTDAMLATLEESAHSQRLRERAQEYSIERVTQMYLEVLNA